MLRLFLLAIVSGLVLAGCSTYGYEHYGRYGYVYDYGSDYRYPYGGGPYRYHEGYRQRDRYFESYPPRHYYRWQPPRPGFRYFDDRPRAFPHEFRDERYESYPWEIRRRYGPGYRGPSSNIWRYRGDPRWEFHGAPEPLQRQIQLQRQLPHQQWQYRHDRYRGR